MQTIRDIAGRINPNTGPVAQFDPMTISVIIGILVSVINMFKACFPQPEPATLTAIHKPKLFQWVRLRRTVRQECAKHGVAYDNEIYEAVRDSRQSLTMDELVKCYEEVQV